MSQKLEDLLKQKVIDKLPEYLIVKTEANEYSSIHEGQEVFHVVGNTINAQKLSDDGKKYEDAGAVVLYDEKAKKIYFTNSQNKDPYVGLNNPVSADVEDGDDVNHKLLEYFNLYVEGRFSFSALVFVEDVLAPDDTEPESSTTTTTTTASTTTTTSSTTTTTSSTTEKQG